jgi:DNA-binding MarR family transcriptional regulator
MNATIPKLPCTCATLRRASRALTQFYEDALRPIGLRASQLSLLQVLVHAGERTQGELGRILAMDSTTLTRTLAIMTRQGWIAKRRGEDRREWRFRLVPAGKARLEAALPHWEQVQQTLRRKLGRERWNALLTLADDVTTAVVEERIEI